MSEEKVSLHGLRIFISLNGAIHGEILPCRISDYLAHLMLIGEKPLRHWIDKFYGYGTWQAEIWFVAHEESGGDLPEEVAEKLDYFYDVHGTATHATLCDIRDVYRHVAIRWESPKAELFRNRFEYRFGSNAALNAVWKNLIAFAHGYRNEALPDPLEYQKHSLASTSSHEALLKLYPLPGASHHGWNYNWLDLGEEFGFLKSRAQYQQHLFEERMRSLLHNIRIYKPRLVLMYAMENINTLKTSVQQSYPKAKFRMIKAVKQRIPQHHRADLDGTTLIITTQIPALRHNRIETGFDWHEFGEKCV